MGWAHKFVNLESVEGTKKMSKQESAAAKKCLTPEFRVSFPAIFKPKAFESQEEKYGLTMLFPKKADLSNLKKIVLNAANDKWGSKDKWPKGLKLPFRDGDEKSDTDGYAGHVFAAAKSKDQPGIVDQKLQPILLEKDFYAGCYARAEVMAYAYDKNGNKGVAFGLQNVQKLREGKSFSGRRSAENVFDSVEDSSDDESSYGSDDSDDLGF